MNENFENEIDYYTEIVGVGMLGVWSVSTTQKKAEFVAWKLNIFYTSGGNKYGVFSAK